MYTDINNKKLLYISVFIFIILVSSLLVFTNISSTNNQQRPNCMNVNYDMSGDYHKVTNVTELYCIGDTPEATLKDSYRLTNNIDASETKNWVVKKQERVLFSSGSGDSFKLSFKPVESTVNVTKDGRDVEYNLYGKNSKDIRVEERGRINLEYETANKPVGGFYPIGVNFVGEFDGNNKTINDLYINQSSMDNTGLFIAIGDRGNTQNVIDSLNSGTVPENYDNIRGNVYDLNVKDANINGVFQSGILSGTNRGVIRNINVTGSSNFTSGGGVVGSNYGFVHNTTSGVKIRSEQFSGGISSHNGGFITDSVSESRINKSSQNSGGVSGTNDGIIRKSGFEGVINADNSGGFVGGNGGIIEKSYAELHVKDNTDLGNIGGFVNNNGEKGIIKESYANVDIYVGNNLGGYGGFVGRNDGEIYNSYTEGQFKNVNRNIGGFVGTNYGKIENSYSDVEGSTGFNGHDNQNMIAGGTPVDSPIYGDQKDVYWRKTVSKGSDSLSDMNGLDFQNTWRTSPNDTPILRNINETIQND